MYDEVPTWSSPSVGAADCGGIRALTVMTSQPHETQNKSPTKRLSVSKESPARPLVGGHVSALSREEEMPGDGQSSGRVPENAEDVERRRSSALTSGGTQLGTRRAARNATPPPAATGGPAAGRPGHGGRRRTFPLPRLLPRSSHPPSCGNAPQTQEAAVLRIQTGGTGPGISVHGEQAGTASQREAAGARGRCRAHR